jgi:TM2 domain-containing membrane protein YozV
VFGTQRPAPSTKQPGTAAVLSLLIPGVGQFYNGDFWRGLFWLIVTPGLWIGTGGLLGWICHVVSAITAYRRAERFNRLAMPFLLLALASTAAAANQAVPPANWLDRPLAGWNKPGLAVSKAPSLDESREQTIKRCRLTLLRTTAAEREVADAGWIPFHNFDQQLASDDVEIVGGMSGTDGMCRPVSYNLFVFVGGRFAGSLSPVLMTSRQDGASGAVRIVARDAITSDFARYTAADALCCPSSRVTVRYRIDRAGPQPVVVPTERADRRP